MDSGNLIKKVEIGQNIQKSLVEFQLEDDIHSSVACLAETLEALQFQIMAVPCKKNLLFREGEDSQSSSLSRTQRMESALLSAANVLSMSILVWLANVTCIQCKEWLSTSRNLSE